MTATKSRGLRYSSRLVRCSSQSGLIEQSSLWDVSSLLVTASLLVSFFKFIFQANDMQFFPSAYKIFGRSRGWGNRKHVSTFMLSMNLRNCQQRELK